MNRLVLGFSVVLSGLLAIAADDARADDVVLGVVDVQKVMEASPEWTKAIGELKREFEKKRAELEAEQNELKKKKEALDARRVVADPDSIAIEEGKLLEAAKAFQERFMRSQQEISQKEAQLKDAMLSRVEVVVNELAQRGDYTYIFEVGSFEQPNVLYSSKKIDVTPEVIAQYKTKYTGKPLGQAEKAPAAK